VHYTVKTLSGTVVNTLALRPPTPQALLMIWCLQVSGTPGGAGWPGLGVSCQHAEMAGETNASMPVRTHRQGSDFSSTHLSVWFIQGFRI